MEVTERAALKIADPSGAAHARRVATDLAMGLGFDETAVGRVALVTSEAATNVVKHAGGGEVLLRTIRADNASAVEVIALDGGPGMRDVAACLRDGYSTAGSAGTGLGAIRRIATGFDIHSCEKRGTALVARVSPARTPVAASRALDVGGVSVPRPGETVCGDVWSAHVTAAGARVVIADGLGHGPVAAEAAAAAVALGGQYERLAPADLMARLHAGLLHTRGAAVAVLDVDVRADVVHFCGVGNVAGVIATSAGRRSLVSLNGTVGREAPRIREFTYPWAADAVLVVHTDGLTTHWNLDAYPGLAGRDPSLVAAVLYRDFKRGRDDVAVVVVRRSRA